MLFQATISWLELRGTGRKRGKAAAEWHTPKWQSLICTLYPWGTEVCRPTARRQLSSDDDDNAGNEWSVVSELRRTRSTPITARCYTQVHRPYDLLFILEMVHDSTIPCKVLLKCSGEVSDTAMLAIIVLRWLKVAEAAFDSFLTQSPSAAVQPITVIHTTVLRLCGICPGQPGWASTRRNIHPLTLIVVINQSINQPITRDRTDSKILFSRTFQDLQRRNSRVIQDSQNSLFTTFQDKFSSQTWLHKVQKVHISNQLSV